MKIISPAQHSATQNFSIQQPQGISDGRHSAAGSAVFTLAASEIVTSNDNFDYVDLFDSALAPLIPPSTNRGGMGPNPAKPGGDFPTPPTIEASCIVDYLTWTFSIDQVAASRKVQGSISGIDGLDWEVSRLVNKLSTIVSHLEWIKNERGLFGYTASISLYRDGKHCGKVAYGGNSGTCMVSLSGTGTSGVDMRRMRAFIEALPYHKITRVDLAHDDLDGSIPLEKWLDYYEQGYFHLRGKMPSRRMIDDFGSGEGKTLYIGRLTNGKEVCIYQKGKQLGDKSSPWVRVEGRLSSVDRVIPSDVLTSPAMYLAGMYPAFDFLCAFAERVQVVKEHARIVYEHAVRHAKLQVGKLLNVMIELGKSPADIVETLVRPGMPKRLEIPLLA